MKNLNDILNRIKEVLELKTDTELTEKLGLSGGVVSNWKARNKIPYAEIFSICEEYKIDTNYIFYGKKDENFKENENFKEKIIKNLEKLNEKELKYFYHLMEAEITKREI